MNKIDSYLPAGEPERGVLDASFTPIGQAGDGETAGFSLSIADVRTMIWRQRWLMAVIVGSCVLIGLIYTLFVTPIYQAAATVQIRQEATNILAGQDVTPRDSLTDSSRYLRTQEQIISSRMMAERVIRSLRLDSDDRFLKAMRARLKNNELPAEQKRGLRHEQNVAQLMANLKATVPIDSRVAQIAFSSPDPLTAARVAQAVADNYITSNIDTTLKSTEYARGFLRGQVDQARARLTEAERRSIAYARNAGLIDASDAAPAGKDGERAGRSLTTATLVRLNADLGTVRAQRIEAEGRWQVAQATPLLHIPEVAQNPTVAALQSERSTAQTQLDQLRTRYRPDYPEVRAASVRLSTINAQIDRVATNIRDSLRNAYQIAQRQERELATEITGTRGDVLTEQQRRVELNVLAQDVDTNRTTLSDLLARFNQVNAAAGITANNLSLVDAAVVPTSPVRPRPFYNLLVALALGLALGLIAATLREAMDDTVRSPDDVERKLQVPILGATPKVKTAGEQLLAGTSSALLESYFSIRAALDYSTSHGRPRTLLVTSSSSGEGKSTSAFALALDYARIGIRTLLVDADLRRPNVHRLGGLPNNHGFVDVLTGQAKLDDVVQTLPSSTLHVLTLGKVVPNPAQLLSGSAVPNFVREQSASYDIIVFDTAPVMGIADTPLISGAVEGTVVIVEAGRSHRGQAKTTLKRLRETGGRVLGVVLTKFDSRDAGYGYEYYNYHYNYSNEDA